MLKLYSGPLSLFSAKVRIALAEKAVDYQLVDVAWSPAAGYEPRHPQVIATNPKRQVPVLVHDDLELYDSTVILEYLEEIHPKPALYPSTPAERAYCRLLELEADEVFFAPVLDLIRASFYPRARGEEPDAARVTAALDAITSHHDRLERQLAEGDHLVGEFGVADIAHALTAYFAAGFGAPVSRRTPRLEAWYERITTRPCVAAEIQSMSDALAAGFAADKARQASQSEPSSQRVATS